MTESEWQACRDPQKMLLFLRDREEVATRKLRLFGLACCRHIWHLLSEEMRRLIEAAEGYVEGMLGPVELGEAEMAASLHYSEYWFNDDRVDRLQGDLMESVATACYFISPPDCSPWYALDWLRPDETQAAMRVARSAVQAIWDWSHDLLEAWESRHLHADVRYDSLAEAASQEKERQSDLVRCIFGNPCRPAPTIGPTMLAWNEQIVIRLAQNIYEDRHLPDGTFDLARLAVLADALEEAGVTDAGLLEHLRGPGHHVRGCCALDAIVGRA